MLQGISPYEFLCQSKPVKPQHIPTEYDRFSTGTPHHYEQASCPPDVMTPAKLPEIIENPSPAKRTHYIADIHARHSSAIRHTTQNSVHI